MTHLKPGGLHELVPLVLLLGTHVPPDHPRHGRANVRNNGNLQFRRSRIRHVWNHYDSLVRLCPICLVLEAVSGPQET